MCVSLPSEMDVHAALGILWYQVSRSSARRVAAAIGVSPATLTRWKGGGVPEGESRELLIKWAETLPNAAQSLAETLSDVERTTAQSMVRISMIYGQLQGVLSMIRSVGNEQENALRNLEPHMKLEEDEAAKLLYEKAARAKAQHIEDEARKPAPASRRRKASGLE